MTRTDQGPLPTSRRVRVLLAAVLAWMLAACGAAATAPGTLPSTASPPAPTSSATASPIPTTITDWGAILDALPAGFPVYPGATDAHTASGPVTAALTTSAGVSTVVAWYVGAMSSAKFTGSAGNPMEDGSVAIDFDGAAKAPGCKALVTVRPQGTQTLILVLVSASCAGS